MTDEHVIVCPVTRPRVHSLGPIEAPDSSWRYEMIREVFSTPIGTRVVIDGKPGTVAGNLPNGVVVVQFDDPLKE